MKIRTAKPEHRIELGERVALLTVNSQTLLYLANDDHAALTMNQYEVYING